MSDQWSWWEQETRADKMLRQLAGKVKDLGRLPTADDLREDAAMPNLPNIATVMGMNLEQAQAELASLLYKRGTQQTRPVELTSAELNKPETERREIEREYQEYYEKRIEEVLKPGGIRAIRIRRA